MSGPEGDTEIITHWICFPSVYNTQRKRVCRKLEDWKERDYIINWNVMSERRESSERRNDYSLGVKWREGRKKWVRGDMGRDSYS